MTPAGRVAAPAWMVALAGCQSAVAVTPGETVSAPPPPRTAPPAASETRALAVATSTAASSDARRFARPWWEGLEPGVYRRADRVAIMAVGRSQDHHHPAEGFLQAKVKARLAVRRAAGTVAFRGSMPEPVLEDFYVTPQAFVALYRLDVPGNVVVPASVAAWPVPAHYLRGGRRRLGRHMFEDARHLFLECDVEGPIANPDWGQTRASAHLISPPRRNR